MENQKDLSLLEMLLMAMNNCLSHKRIFLGILLVPTLVMFVLVMWVFTPQYKAEAIFTPPVETPPITTMGIGKSSLGDIPGNSALSELLGNTDDGAGITATFAESWELHVKIIEKFELARDYKFKGKFYADLLKKFRSDLELEYNDDDMFEVSFTHTDYKKAAAVVDYFLTQLDSMYNAYKTNQARQTREYIDSRIEEINKEIEVKKKEFVKFQRKNDFYEPGVQLESSLRYLTNLQMEREAILQELAYEREKKGGATKRLGDLEQRLRNIEKTIDDTKEGKQSDMGVVALGKTPELFAQYTALKNDLKIQQSIYMLLREQREQLDIEANNRQVNLIVLQPPWENDKRVFPKRGTMLLFTFMISGLMSVAICTLIEFFKNLDSESRLAKEKSKFVSLLLNRR